MEHRRVVLGLRIRSGEQFFADEERIGAGHKAKRDRFARKRTAPGAQANHRRGHQDARRGDRAHENQRVERLLMFQRSSLDAHQHIDGHAFRMRIERGKLVQQADAIVLGFAHADNSAAADRDSRFSHRREGAQAVVVVARGDDLAVKLRRSIQIVVVGSQAGFGQALGLRSSSMPSEQQTSMPSLATRRTISRTFSKSSPSRTSRHAAPMQKRVAPSLAGALGKFRDFVHGEQTAARDFRRVVRALRAVGAILRASAGLHREQPAELHARGIVKFAVQLAARRTEDRAAAAGRSREFLRESSHGAKPSWLPKRLYRFSDKGVPPGRKSSTRRSPRSTAQTTALAAPAATGRRKKHSSADSPGISTSHAIENWIAIDAKFW